MNSALKSKTLWFSAALAMLGALEMQGAYLREVVGPENFGLVMILISATTAVLRIVTTQALSEK